MRPQITLNTGDIIPIIGFGTWKIQGEEAKKAICSAIEIGYRHFDTAAAYDNHREVGQAIRASGLAHEEFFLTTKVWHSYLAYDDVIASCREALQELEIDFIDLYLIHWPNQAIPIRATIAALQFLKNEGMIRAYGVSNFTIDHVQRLLSIKDTLGERVQISMNQIEIHPSFYQKELIDFCRKNSIAVTAYSPIAQGRDLELPLIKELAHKYGKTEAQIILNWIMQKDIVAIPKAATAEHMKENFEATEWDLNPEDSVLIDSFRLEQRTVRPHFTES